MTRGSSSTRGGWTLQTRCGIRVPTVLRALAVGLIWFAADVAHAYVGPGAGLAAIGTLLALLGAVLLALVGFAWYPVKRLVRYVKNRRKQRAEAEADEGGNEIAPDGTASP